MTTIGAAVAASDAVLAFAVALTTACFGGGAKSRDGRNTVLGERYRSHRGVTAIANTISSSSPTIAPTTRQSVTYSVSVETDSVEFVASNILALRSYRIIPT